MIPRVVSIAVPPPEAIGAYLSSFTIRGIVIMVMSSRMKFAVKPKVPHVGPISCPIIGPLSVYQPYPELTAMVPARFVWSIKPATKPPMRLPKATRSGKETILNPVFLIFSTAFLSMANEKPKTKSNAMSAIVKS